MSVLRFLARSFANKLVTDYECEREMITAILRDMNDSNRWIFEKRFNARKKSLSAAYVFLFAGFGSHYLYLGQWRTQLLFWLTLGGGFVWYAISAVTMYYLVDRANRETAFAIIGEIWEEHRVAEVPAVPDATDGLPFVGVNTPSPIKLSTIRFDSMQ